MIGIFITARLGSTRLTEKHLIEVQDIPFIKWLANRFSIAFEQEIENNEVGIFITTSKKAENKKFETVFKNCKVQVFYGSEENIPLRHLECAVMNNIDYIVSIDGDDILCSTEASKIVVNKLLNGSKIVQTTGLPLGMNVMGYSKFFLNFSLSGMTTKKLDTGWGKIFNKDKIEVIQLGNKELNKNIRMTLDYDKDADFFKKVISNIDVLNISDDNLIDSIIKKKWHLINDHLDVIYWSNFNRQKEEEN